MSENGKNTGKVGKGNPPVEHRFSSTNQPENRRKPSILKSVSKHLLEEGFIKFQGEEVDENGKLTGRITFVRVKFPNQQALAIHYIQRAKKSDIILKDLMDRIDGKAVGDTTTNNTQININNDKIRINFIDDDKW